MCELRNQKDTGKLIDLAWLWFKSPHNEVAAKMMRTSEPPHWRKAMKTLAAILLVGVAFSLNLAGPAAAAQRKIVGVSWSNFQEERWKTDEAAIKAAVAGAGGKYISADAQSSAQKQ